MSLHLALTLVSFLIVTTNQINTDEDEFTPPETPAPTTSEFVAEKLEKAEAKIERAYKTNKNRQQVYFLWEQTINEINQTLDSNLEANEFAYLTPNELNNHLLGFQEDENLVSHENRFSVNRKAVGTTMDPPEWTGDGPRPDQIEIVNWDSLFYIPPKDQGYCGSCWAFIGSYCLEHWYMRNTGNPYIDSSEQQHIACPIETNGCIGGDHRRVFAMNRVKISQR